MSWDPVGFKAQLRLTSQRLAQIQQRQEANQSITKRDISYLLQQGNVSLARAKAQKLILEDASGDLLEVLEMHVGVILEHFGELETSSESPAPIVVEAASSIIFAATRADSKDLNIVRDLLIHRLGPDFARSAAGNRDGHVAPRVINRLNNPPATAANMNSYLSQIAKAYGVKWTPDPTRQEILHALSEILDPNASPIVDLPRLRRLCCRGLPDEPRWLRPRIWKLFFGILPVLKSAWEVEIRKHRESYYDLLRRLLGPLSSLPEPTYPLSSADEALLKVSKQLSRVPPSLFSGLDEEPDSPSALDEPTSEQLRVDCAGNLDARLRRIHNEESSPQVPPATPEIRLQMDDEEPEMNTPEISVSSPEAAATVGSGSFASRRSHAPTTLVPSKAYNAAGAHQKHSSALLRLLYLHSCLNPANRSPHIPTLLVPLYAAMMEEVELADLAHAEADAFWLFEAMIADFSELEEEEGGNLWMKRLGQRLSWADEDLFANLEAKGLDPALPHYSYRWLAPILTQTLPLPAVYLVWDSLFSCPRTERDHNPKIEYLLDICIAMLIRAKPALIRLGKQSEKSPGGRTPARAQGLWGEVDETLPPPSPIRAWELGDAFLEGMQLLQRYPLEGGGGMDIILQIASDLSLRRHEARRAQKVESLSFGERLKVSMWKGFTNQTSTPNSPSLSPAEEEDDVSEVDVKLDEGNETETPTIGKSAFPPPISSEAPLAAGLTSRLTTAMWRGITNQSSMDVPPSPMEPITPTYSPTPSPSPSPSPSSSRLTSIGEESSAPSPTLSASSSIWGYAGKLKESNAAAALSKASTNWRAKSFMASWGGQPGPASEPDVSSPPPSRRQQSVDLHVDHFRRGSMPIPDRSLEYSPPTRPAYFRPPRDSMIPQSRRESFPVDPADVSMSPQSEPAGGSGFASKTKNLQASLASLTGISRTPSPSPQPARSGPRPLLLNSSSLITTATALPSRYSVNGSTQWGDVARANQGHRQSQSSISSLAPSQMGRRSGTRSDWESDTGSSRLVPINNRKSVSPMAPSFSRRSRPDSVSSSGTSSDRGILSPPPPLRLELDSPVSPPSSLSMVISPQEARVGLQDAFVPLELPVPEKKLVRKKTPPSTHANQEETSDSDAAGREPSRSPRTRSKRQQRPANLRIRDGPKAAIAEQMTISPSSLAPPTWPEDHDVALTPKASHFDEESQPMAPSPSGTLTRTRKVSTDGTIRRSRKVSTDGIEARSRKLSSEGGDPEVRPRKTSTASTRSRKLSSEGKRVRESAAAEEGDDEGYDDLLSAYESEEGSNMSAVVRAATRDSD